MDLEQQIRNQRVERANQLRKSMSSDISKGGALGQEGEVRTYANGKKYKKTGNKWVEVGSDKKSKKQDEKGGEKNKAQAGESSVDRHETAQLTHMKSLVESGDHAKAYEIYQSLSPEAQNAVPQNIVNDMVKDGHSEKTDPAKEIFEDKKDVKKEEKPAEKPTEKKESLKVGDTFDMYGREAKILSIDGDKATIQWGNGDPMTQDKAGLEKMKNEGPELQKKIDAIDEKNKQKEQQKKEIQASVKNVIKEALGGDLRLSSVSERGGRYSQGSVTPEQRAKVLSAFKNADNSVKTDAKGTYDGDTGYLDFGSHTVHLINARNKPEERIAFEIRPKRDVQIKKAWDTLGFTKAEDLKGGLADGMSCGDIAKKHGVTKEAIEAQLAMGIKVEMEHTNDKSKASEIAHDHLFEDPKYYTKLAKMESVKKSFKILGL